MARLNFKAIRNNWKPVCYAIIALQLVNIAVTALKPKDVVYVDAATSGPAASGASTANYPMTDTETEQWVRRRQQDKADYSLKLEDNFIVVFDGDRVVGTLTYKTSLGRMMLRDNE